jgi:hypothetical protein
MRRNLYIFAGHPGLSQHTQSQHKAGIHLSLSSGLFAINDKLIVRLPGGYAC